MFAEGEGNVAWALNEQRYIRLEPWGREEYRREKTIPRATPEIQIAYFLGNFENSIIELVSGI